jgi:phage gp36-like protein
MAQIYSYATYDDMMNSGIVPQFFTGDLAPTPDAIIASLVNASSYIDSIISSSDKITLPLAEPYDPQLIFATVSIAMWNLLTVRGYNPDEPSDKAIRMRYEDANKWLDKIANGRAKLIRQATTQNVDGIQPDVLCNESRGLRNWNGMIRGGNGW